MPRYNVMRPDGKWACFSTAVDDFVSGWMDEKEYERWQKLEFGTGLTIPVRYKKSRQLDYERAVRCIVKAHGHYSNEYTERRNRG